MQPRVQAQTGAERPYRSHLRPACGPCRRRKSRCQTDGDSDACLTCRAHKTLCSFVDGSHAQQISGRHNRPATSRGPARGSWDATVTASTPTRNARKGDRRISTGYTSENTATGTTSASYRDRNTAAQNQPVGEQPTTLGSADEQHVNMHIVGPIATNDTQVLSDYLSGIPGATRSTRMMIPASASQSKPILFTLVQKRPVGVTVKSSPSAEKLEIIEKLLESHTDALIDGYFQRVNSCLPIVDEASFRGQFQSNKQDISPALLACLYANSLAYWGHCPSLSRHRCPDARYIWNLASEAVYSELHLAPGMSVINACLLNVGGRPTTSLIGNGVLLSSAVSMAHSLGLNHNPLPWEIPVLEKNLRMKIWWALLLHDRWTSLAHGTPPLILHSQHDIPLPLLEHICEPNASTQKREAALLFIALMGLTDVLDSYLQNVYQVGKDKTWNTSNLESRLNGWVESLSGTCRLVVIRGSHLHISGAANLRFAYLTTRLLLQRIELEADKAANASEERILNRYMYARRTAEDVLIFTQELQPEQLGDFWLSTSAFAFPATVNFLLRCALETENSPAGLAQSGSFRIARELIDTLRAHQEKTGWDLADICLAQHAEIVDKVLAGVAPVEGESNNDLDFADFIMPDASIMDQFFPSLWDPLQNAW